PRSWCWWTAGPRSGAASSSTPRGPAATWTTCATRWWRSSTTTTPPCRPASTAASPASRAAGTGPGGPRGFGPTPFGPWSAAAALRAPSRLSLRGLFPRPAPPPGNVQGQRRRPARHVGHGRLLLGRAGRQRDPALRPGHRPAPGRGVGPLGGPRPGPHGRPPRRAAPRPARHLRGRRPPRPVLARPGRGRVLGRAGRPRDRACLRAVRRHPLRDRVPLPGRPGLPGRAARELTGVTGRFDLVIFDCDGVLVDSE